MKRISEIMRGLPLTAKSAVITLFVLVFSHVLVYDLMSVSFFSPMEKASDFRFSDFYTIVADDRDVAILDPDIVIVPVDGMTRKEIARVIDDIDFCEPAAVGLDIAFAPPSNPDDDPLAESLAECSNLVMPIRIVEKEDTLHAEHLSYYDNIVEPTGGFAAVNIQGDLKERSTVRNFTKSFETAEGRVKSLPVALVAIARPEAAKRMEERGSEEEFIRYASRRFDIIAPEDIIEDSLNIKGKIVMVGKMHNAGDLHVTPLDNFTPGLQIHALTAATIISGDYIMELAPFESYAIAAIACFIIVWLNMRYYDSPAGPFAVRVMQAAMLYLMIVVGTMAYIYWNIDLNFSFAIMATVLGVSGCDVYIGFFAKGGILDQTGRLFKKKQRDTI